MKTLTIQLPDTTKNYNIYIAPNLLASTQLHDYCKNLDKRLVIITDSNLEKNLGVLLQKSLQEKNVAVDMFFFPAGEQHKTRETKQYLEDLLLEKQYGRDTCIIALGGGIVLDMAGFLASTYCRGIPIIYIPTSLLAMVDACIGGKTGLNTSHGKNLIGTFSQPSAVFIDPSTLNSLPKREWSNGIVEAIKHALIADPILFDSLMRNNNIDHYNSDFLCDFIYQNCLIKKKIIEQDLQEQNKRHLLNFGHTIGHAIENIENYTIRHGEAVAIGILIESHISMLHGFLSAHDLSKIQKILQLFNLPLQTSALDDLLKFQNTLMSDKKSIKKIPRFSLLKEIGVPVIEQDRYAFPVELDLLHRALTWGAQTFSRMK